MCMCLLVLHHLYVGPLLVLLFLLTAAARADLWKPFHQTTAEVGDGMVQIVILHHQIEISLLHSRPQR